MTTAINGIELKLLGKEYALVVWFWCLVVCGVRNKYVDSELQIKKKISIMAPRLNKSLILEKFNICAERENAKCKICGSELKKNRLFNLKAHLVKMHEISISDIETSNTVSSAITKKEFRKQTVKIEISEKQLFRSYIGLVTEDSVPFNVLNSDNMRNIIDPICRGLGEKMNKHFRFNSSNCKTVLKSVVIDIQNNIKMELKHRLISLKIDSATRLSRNIFGLSAQFIKNNIITSTILGMVELKDTASSSCNLATEIINVLSKYNVDLNQVVSITSDNGGNMIKTTKMLSHCSIFKTSYDDGEEEEPNEVYLRNIELFEDSNNLQIGDIQICRYAAHTAQLCALDVTKDTRMKRFLINCRNFVKYIKKYINGYREIFELKKLNLPQLDCSTRWGSTYNMICNIYKAKEVLQHVDSIKNKSHDENFELSNDFWDFVSSYCTVFEPLQKTIIKFQEEQLHYGNFYAQWLKCKIMTKKIVENNADNNPFMKKLGNKLLNCIASRTTKLLTNESLTACLFLDPRFSHTLTAEHKKQAINYLKRLYDRVKAIGCIIPEKTNASDDNTNETFDVLKEEDEYLNEYLLHNFRPQYDDEMDTYSKIANFKMPYQRVEINVLDFWYGKQFTDPELFALAIICFAIPSTQVTIERAFSSLKLILSDNRNRLNDETLENVLMVKLNPSFLDRAIDHLPLFEDIDSDQNEDL